MTRRRPDRPAREQGDRLRANVGEARQTRYVAGCLPPFSRLLTEEL